MKRQSNKTVRNLIWPVAAAAALILFAPALSAETESEQSDPNAPKGKIRGYQAERDLKTGKIRTYPVYEDQMTDSVRYRVKVDASGEPVKDEEGNFIFIAEPNEPLPVPPTSPPGSGTTGPFKSKLLPPKYSVDIGPEIYHFKYEEPEMEETGMFYGVRFGITSREWSASPQASEPDGGAMFRAEGRLAFGWVDYDGALLNGTPYKVNNIDDLAFEGRLLIGGERMSAETLSTLYAGVGYRYLNDNLAVDPAGYERESNYLYIPLGFNIDIGRDVGWSLGFGAEFDFFVLGRQESHLSDYNPAFLDIENDQDSGYGYRASLKVQNKSRDGIFIIEPFFRYWDINRSDLDDIYDNFIEPANETTEFGLQLIWLY